MPDQEWFRSNWNILKPQIRAEWPLLSENDLQIINGDINQLLYLLQTKYGWLKEQSEQQIQKFIDHQIAPTQERREPPKFPPVDEEEDL